VGVALKHPQLAHQERVFIEHPPENSMASLSFTSTVLNEGTAFIFDSWICIANSSGGFNSHVVDSKKMEASTHNALDEFIDNLNELLLPNLVLQIEKMSIFNVISTHTAPKLVGSDSNQSEGTTESMSLSDLEEDFDLLLKLKDVGATACWGGHF
jgi:hypothetical protein